ncbi:MAG: 30S ribosomal protein S7 [Candidatus Thermoplasmatota archaeon]|nr:30S ribosomal protein S7 [Candidatus Thermoplasmatota archaeon]MBS3802355.1 30S ribosomal protein S7 [Candidatus Thermoplasmatota archaeon]
MAEKTSGQKQMHFFPSLEKYNQDEVMVEDKGLARYINLDTENIYLGAVFANKMFAKSKIPVVERLINNIMRTKRYNGKKIKAYKVVRSTFEIIDKRTKKNPLQILVHAIQNSAPKEEATRLRFGGILVPKAVDTAPQRRLDIALRNICTGAVNASHKNKKRIEYILADEIIKASKNDVSSFSVGKKNEIERVAKSAR